MYAIYNDTRSLFLIADALTTLEYEGWENIWYEEAVFSEGGGELGLINIEIFDTLDEALEAKETLEAMSWDKLVVLKMKHAWVFRVDHSVKVPQGNKAEEE